MRVSFAHVSIDVEAWYRKHSPMVLRRCRFLLRDEASALDAMQDVFVEILRRADQLEERGACSYLWRAATNICLNRLASHKRAPADADDELLLEIAASDDFEARSIAANLLQRVFGGEPQSTRLIATLFYVDKMTHQEVAEAVGMSVSGVRKRLRTLQLRARGAVPEPA